MSDTPPEVTVEPAHRSLRSRMSVVWLIPLAALIISMGIAWQNYASRGPLIEIAFESASGVREGETELRYRNVAVGRVEKISFSQDLSKVLVAVRLEKGLSNYVDDDASFWIVSPEVTPRGVSGLETVLSGVYIEGSWDQTPTGLRQRFDGATKAPLVKPGEEGLTILLTASGGEGISNDTPILYKGLEVGKVANVRLAEDGLTTLADAFINAPYDRLVTSSTRFWDTSGFTFSFGPGGASVDFKSLASLLSGGISFDTIVSGGEAANENDVFKLFEDENAARNSIFASTESEATVPVSVIFDGNASGLGTGSAIELRGVNVGQVTGVTGIVDPLRFGDRKVRLLATLSLKPGKMGLGEGADEEDTLAFLEDRIQAGLRARLATANILTGGLKVELLLMEDAPPAILQRDAEPYPIFPSVESDIADVAATAEGVFQRINSLPIEELLGAAISFLDGATTLINSESLQQTPDEVLAILGEVRRVVGAEQVQALPEQVGTAAGNILTAVDDLQTMTQQLRAAEGVAKLVAAVESAGDAAASVNDLMTREVPPLLENIAELAATANALPLDELVNRVTALAASAERILSSEAAAGLPADVSGALQEAQGLLTELRAQGAVAKLVTAIEQAGAAAQSFQTVIVTDVPPLMAGLSTLSTDLSALARKADALPLEDLVTRTSSLVASADRVLGTEAAATLPASVNATLENLRAVLAQVQDEDGVPKLVAAIQSADRAAQSIDAVARTDIPPLVQQLSEVSSDLSALAQKAGDLPVEELIARTSALVESANAVLATESARQLPTAINATLSNIRGLLDEVRREQGVQKLVAAVEAAGAAARNVETASADLPVLMDNLTALSAKVDALPLDAMVQEVTDFMASADALVGSDSARQLPASVNAALAEVEQVLRELREGGTVANANATLASAQRAAGSIERAADQLPSVVRRLNLLLQQSETTLAAYSEDSKLNYEARAALRDVQKAAKAIESLARAIERRPNSLLTGR